MILQLIFTNVVGEVRRQYSGRHTAHFSRRVDVVCDCVSVLVHHELNTLRILPVHLIAHIEQLEWRVVLVPHKVVRVVARALINAKLVAQTITFYHVLDAHKLLRMLRRPPALVLNQRVRLTGLLNVRPLTLYDPLDAFGRIPVGLGRAIRSQVAQERARWLLHCAHVLSGSRRERIPTQRVHRGLLGAEAEFLLRGTATQLISLRDV